MTEIPAIIAHVKVFDRLSDTHLEEERRAEQGTISLSIPIFGTGFGLRFPLFLLDSYRIENGQILDQGSRRAVRPTPGAISMRFSIPFG